MAEAQTTGITVDNDGISNQFHRGGTSQHSPSLLIPNLYNEQFAFNNHILTSVTMSKQIKIRTTIELYQTLF